MTRSISATEPHRFIPDHRAEEENPPTYLLDIPTFRSKSKFQNTLQLEGVYVVSPFEKTRAMKRAIKDVVHESDQHKYLDLTEEHGTLVSEMEAENPQLATQLQYLSIEQISFEGVSADQKARAIRLAELIPLMVDLENQLLDEHPALRRLRARDHKFGTMFPYIAAQHFLCGWENVDAEFRRENGLVPEDLMELIIDDVAFIGWTAASLTKIKADEAKNSASPSTSPSAQKSTTTNSGTTTAEAIAKKQNGSSAKKSTRKTRKKSSKPGPAR